MDVNELRERAVLLRTLPSEQLGFLASVASEASYSASEILFREDQPADKFFIVEKGLISLELMAPGSEPMVILSLGPTELLGISWMVPPYTWKWTARATVSSRLIQFDAVRVRERCEEDPDLKLWVLQMVSDQAVRRLHSTRVQLLDLYESR